MAIDASRLQVSVEEKERWRRRMSVTVPADLVEEEREKAAEKLASRLDLPGFRKGKVPTGVVEQKYGAALRQETLDRIINDAYQGALQSSSLRPISEGQVEDVEYRTAEDLTFAISFDVQPEIELGRLGGFTVERPSPEVGEDDVQNVLDRVREQNAVWEPLDEGSPDDGDLVQVRIEQLDDGDEETEPREYEFVLGRDEAIPDVEEAIATLEVGEEEDFTISFPDDMPDEGLRGESRRIRIGLLGRKAQDLPEVDDALARSVGDFDSVDELLDAIRSDLAAEAEEQAEKAVRSRILESLLEANDFQIPESMVEGYVQQVAGEAENMSDEELERAKASLRPEAERAVKRALLIDRVAETQGLRATEDELDERKGRLSSLERQITENKVFDFLKEKSTIVQAEG